MTSRVGKTLAPAATSMNLPMTPRAIWAVAIDGCKEESFPLDFSSFRQQTLWLINGTISDMIIQHQCNKQSAVDNKTGVQNSGLLASSLAGSHWRNSDYLPPAFQQAASSGIKSSRCHLGSGKACFPIESDKQGEIKIGESGSKTRCHIAVKIF